MSLEFDAAPAPTPPDEYYDQGDSENRCVLCSNPDYSIHKEISHFGFPFRFSRCQCGLIKQTPMPNEQFFEWFFNSDLFISSKRFASEQIWGFYDYLRDEPCRLSTSKYRYWRLSRIFESGDRKRIMKIGPSTGSFLYVAKEHGHEVLGSDVSSQFVDFAQEQYGVQIDQGRFEKQEYPAGSFDAVLLFNVIENVPNIGDFLDSIHRSLGPGGYFILNHVDMARNWIERFQGKKYFLYRPPICYIFEMPVLRRLLRKHGFEVEGVYRDVRFMHLEKILTLLGWKTPLRIAEALQVHRFRFPVPAYPSRILVTRKVGK